MADSATFLESVGGDGSTVTDDANPTTGLANGGHRKRFVPALSQVVAVASNTVNQALLAKDWAVKTDGAVSGAEFSAKYHALAAEDSREQTQGYAETIIAMTNIDFGGFSIVDGELLTTYVDLGNSVPSIVDGEFVITY